MSDFKIVRRSRYQYLPLWLFIIVVVVAAYFWGAYKSQTNTTLVIEDKKQLSVELTQANVELESVIKELKITKQQLQLKEKLVDNLKQDFKRLSKEKEKLSASVQLYDQIMKSNSDKNDYMVLKLHLYPVQKYPIKADEIKDKSIYRFDYFLVNYAINKKLLKGSATLTLMNKNDKEVDKQIYSQKGKLLKNHPIRFKFYQQTSNYIALEKGQDVVKVIFKMNVPNSQLKTSELIVSRDKFKEIRYVGK